MSRTKYKKSDIKDTIKLYCERFNCTFVFAVFHDENGDPDLSDKQFYYLYKGKDEPYMLPMSYQTAAVFDTIEWPIHLDGTTGFDVLYFKDYDLTIYMERVVSDNYKYVVFRGWHHGEATLADFMYYGGENRDIYCKFLFDEDEQRYKEWLEAK